MAKPPATDSPAPSTTETHSTAPPTTLTRSAPHRYAHDDTAVADESHHRNHVVLAGRLTAEPAIRELPSGDRIVTWRVAVTRPVAERRPNQKVDAITCVSFCPSVQSSTREWRIGDLVEVTGALRRRFWRSSGGASSVFEVEADNVARLSAHSRLADEDGPSS